MTKKQHEKTIHLSEYIRPEKKKAKDVSLCIINDSAVIREGILSFVEDYRNINKFVCTNRNDFFNLFYKKDNDIIITDIEFGNKIDPTVIKNIKKSSPNSEIIVITRLENGYMRNITLDYGATFFIYWEDQFQLLEIITKTMINKIQKKGNISINTKRLSQKQ